MGMSRRERTLEDAKRPEDEKQPDIEGTKLVEKMEEETQSVEEEMELEIDVFALGDVCNYRDGEPLFAKFSFEDWTLLSLRLELHLLAHAFCKDAADPERVGIHEMHLPFYYNKYFRKSFNVKYYGVDDIVGLVGLIKDTVAVNSSNQVVETQLKDDTDNFDTFVKLTEDARRRRQQRIDAGEETARLKFQRPELPTVAPGGGYRGRDDRRRDKGEKGVRHSYTSGHPAHYHHPALAGKGHPLPAPAGYGYPPPPAGPNSRKGGGAPLLLSSRGACAPPAPMPPIGKGGYGPAGTSANYGHQRHRAPYPPPPVHGGYMAPGGARYK